MRWYKDRGFYLLLALVVILVGGIVLVDLILFLLYLKLTGG